MMHIKILSVKGMSNLQLSRLRKTPAIRKMLQETRLHPSMLIAPIFITDIHANPHEITSMPGIFQWPLQALSEELDAICNAGLNTVLLFGVPSDKDALGSHVLRPDGLVAKAIRQIKTTHPHLTVIADVCLCEYTSHGHCGILNEQNHIDLEKTRTHLATQAIQFAEAGVDWVAPSSMTDGMVKAIREGLDAHQFYQVAILSYAVKYSSCFYGPFREAAQGAPKFGDRKHYQMHIGNQREALREASLDLEEGADILMVKPAMHYLDVISKLKTHFETVPLCAYQVSGEYAMLKHAARMGIVNEQEAFIESLTAIKRSGADMIISYFSKYIDWSRYEMLS